MRQTKTFSPYSVSLLDESFADCYQYLLGDRFSRRYLSVNRTQVPALLCRAHLCYLSPFLATDSQPHLRCTKFGPAAVSLQCSFNGDPFTERQLFRHVQASTFPELWYRYMTESDHYHGGALTRWIAAMSAAT
jgi:hypothetical protein